MTSDELRNPADRAAELLNRGECWPPDLLAVLGPAARQLADLLDAVGDPEELRSLSAAVGYSPMVGRHVLNDIADAAAAARGEG